MGHILSLVLTAKRHRLVPVPMPDPFLESRAGVGVLAHAEGVPCFMEDLVVLSRDGGPATSTLRNLELDGTGGLGPKLGEVKQWATAGQVGHAASAAVDAPTSPSSGQAWAAREMEPSSCSPPIQNPPCG
jgi:hypothetical protein